MNIYFFARVRQEREMYRLKHRDDMAARVAKETPHVLVAGNGVLICKTRSLRCEQRCLGKVHVGVEVSGREQRAQVVVSPHIKEKVQ